MQSIGLCPKGSGKNCTTVLAVQKGQIYTYVKVLCLVIANVNVTKYMCRRNVKYDRFVAIRQWRFYVGDRGTGPQILPRPPKFLIGSIVISLSRCCLPNDEGPSPQIFFLEPPLLSGLFLSSKYSKTRFPPGLCPDPATELYDAPPESLVGAPPLTLLRSTPSVSRLQQARQHKFLATPMTE